jgi:hypothetical protein
VAPHVAYSAFNRLSRSSTAKAALSDVLLGFWRINDLSTVTITRELGKDFGPIRPVQIASQEGGLQSLWSEFVELVIKVLIPFAQEKVVYADLRPGWTETPNILRKRLSNGSNLLRLIDYESLCLIVDVPPDDAGRVFHPSYDDTVHEADYTAMRHLMWQCMFTAYVWAMQLDPGLGDSEYDSRQFVTDFHSNSLNREFLEEPNLQVVFSMVQQQDITDVMVKRLLHLLGGAPGLKSES